MIMRAKNKGDIKHEFLSVPIVYIGIARRNNWKTKNFK